MDHNRILLASQGYMELGMLDDALAELATLPPEAQREPAAMEMRVLVLTHAKRWQEALEISRELCVVAPEEPGGFIHAAFCLHELGRSAEAKETLIAGPPALMKEATFHYNLACYECALGNLDAAKQHLERSIAMDKKFRDFAKTDPDLEPLRH